MGRFSSAPLRCLPRPRRVPVTAVLRQGARRLELPPSFLRRPLSRFKRSPSRRQHVKRPLPGRRSASCSTAGTAPSARHLVAGVERAVGGVPAASAPAASGLSVTAGHSSNAGSGTPHRCMTPGARAQRERRCRLLVAATGRPVQAPALALARATRLGHSPSAPNKPGVRRRSQAPAHRRRDRPSRAQDEHTGAARLRRARRRHRAAHHPGSPSRRDRAEHGCT